MGETPPLEELASRKRLVQAKLDLHRAELALYYGRITAPLQIMRKGARFLTRPAVSLAAVGAVGWLLFSGRLNFLHKTTGFIVPMLLPRLRGLLVNRTLDMFFKGFRLFR